MQAIESVLLWLGYSLKRMYVNYSQIYSTIVLIERKDRLSVSVLLKRKIPQTFIRLFAMRLNIC